LDICSFKVFIFITAGSSIKFRDFFYFKT